MRIQFIIQYPLNVGNLRLTGYQPRVSIKYKMQEEGAEKLLRELRGTAWNRQGDWAIFDRVDTVTPSILGREPSRASSAKRFSFSDTGMKISSSFAWRVRLSCKFASTLENFARAQDITPVKNKFELGF